MLMKLARASLAAHLVLGRSLDLVSLLSNRGYGVSNKGYGGDTR